MNTENSTEYQILKFLNDRNSEYDIVAQSLYHALKLTTRPEIDAELIRLRGLGYIGDKTEREKGLTILEQGQKRYNKMHTDVQTETLIKNTAKRVSTQEWIMAVLTLVIATLTGFQVDAMYEQNELIKEQIDIMGKESKHTCPQIPNPATIQLNVSVKDTILTKDVTPKKK